MHSKIRVGTDIIEMGMSKLDPIWKLLNGWLDSIKLKQAWIVGMSNIVLVNTPKLFDFYKYMIQT